MFLDQTTLFLIEKEKKHQMTFTDEYCINVVCPHNEYNFSHEKNKSLRSNQM